MRIIFSCLVAMWAALSSATGQITFVSVQESIGSRVNTKYFEERIVMSPDGHHLYFTRANAPGNIGGTRDNGDIWVTELLGNGEWGEATNVGRPLNNEDRNEVVGFFNGGKGMILNYHYDDRRTTNNGVSLSYFKDEKWTKPENIDIRYFQNRSHHQTATLSHDERVLILSLMSYGTFGVEDLYVCRLESNGEWSDPQNLGSSVNTAFQEITPFLADDGRTLFFATNGRGGEGSLDIFMTQRQDESWRNWSEPENLGTAVNTPGAEYSFRYHSGSPYAYFVSTQNSDGYGDIKRVQVSDNDILPTEVYDSVPSPLIGAGPDSILLVTSVRDAASGDLIPSAITLTYEKSEDSVTVAHEDSAPYTITIAVGQPLHLMVDAVDHMPFDTLLVFPDALPPKWEKDFNLAPLSVGSTFTLQNVLFEQGTATLVPGSEAGLEQVVRLMKQNPGIAIELSGHTDNRGIQSLNVTLSEERVAAVEEYLVAHGIDGERITGKGYGGSRPIASNLSEKTRRLNRRVEFTIVKK